MPTLTLVSHPLCPFVQRAAIALLEKQVPFERIDVDLQNKPDWFMTLSPTGKVPVLQIQEDDGTSQVLFESVAICEYVDETQPGPSLYPADPFARAQHRAWVEFGTATLGEAWGYLNARDEAAAAARTALLAEKLGTLEKALGAGPYFGGEGFGMVDLVFAPVFRYFDIVEGDTGTSCSAEFPKVDAWRRQLSARPSVKVAVSKEYPELFRAHLQRSNALLAR